MLEEPQTEANPLLNSAFNGALQTLERIHLIILDIHKYKVNDHVIGYKENLWLLLVESQGFLNKDELQKARKDWQAITGFKILLDKEAEVCTFDTKLLDCLDDFYIWLRLRLHKSEVTMPKKKDFINGMNKLIQRYGLSENG